jgi:hypothetical protein
MLQQLLSGAGREHAVTLGEHPLRALGWMAQVQNSPPTRSTLSLPLALLLLALLRLELTQMVLGGTTPSFC